MNQKIPPDKCMHYCQEPDGSFSVYDQFKGDLMRIFRLNDPDCFKKVLLGVPRDDIVPILRIKIYFKKKDVVA